MLLLCVLLLSDCFDAKLFTAMKFIANHRSYKSVPNNCADTEGPYLELLWTQSTNADDTTASILRSQKDKDCAKNFALK